MCLGIPGKIIRIGKDRRAEADFGGVRREVQLDLLPGATKGDYVMVHAGFAIQKLTEEEALDTLKIIDEAFNMPGDENK
ncbi:MAG: HypC/HybG/HupF family hydrogenase formation chaperone [Endomicrobiales bacterium]|nr:HypC/HybG/HupF family hydrogenase formation chaperone [Endomicrobiales bacterium]